MRPLWALLDVAYLLSMRHGYAYVCGDSLHARVQDNILSIDMRLLWRINRCSLFAIYETRLCLCVRRVVAGTGLSKHLVNRPMAAVGITWCSLLAIDETRLCLCVRRLTAGTGLSQRLINIHVAIVGITRCGLLAIDEARLCLCVRHVAASTGLCQRLVNRYAATVGITWCNLLGMGLSQCLVNTHAAVVGSARAKILMCWVFVSTGTSFVLVTSASAARRMVLVFGIRAFVCAMHELCSACVVRLDPFLSSNVLTRMPSQSWGRRKLVLLEVGFLSCLLNAQELSCTIG
ncbi:hypothetical protein HAX54_003150 [Datura stramonium]|uniref:Secreted protein n=1 Tax=Datura stramonium TaxID=4076 RepID=A0ABS8WVN0_DATST|nr:hypothetical protein [Datura stramonium]